MADHRVGDEMSKARLADPLKARILLMTGGIFGLHRFYLDEIPEAFIFFSTGGVFLLGVVYDSFYINKNGKLLANLSKMVRFSLLRFSTSVAYAVWLGFLCWLAGSVMLGRIEYGSLVMTSALAAAVAIGVYIVGNCGMEARSPIYVWLGSFSSIFIHFRFVEEHIMRALFFAAVISTLLGNRTATIRTTLHRPFNWKHLVFWTSLFGLLTGIIAVGMKYHIFQKEVLATFPNKSRTTTVGTLLYDRFLNQHRVHNFFKGGPALSFVAYSSHSRRRNTLFDVELVDKAPLWADMVAVFIIDMLYQEVRVLEKRSVIEPLQWALWRVYLIVKFDAPAFISQPELKRTCLQWIRKQTNSSNKRDFTEKKKESRDYHFLGISRGCDIMTK